MHFGINSRRRRYLPSTRHQGEILRGMHMVSSGRKRSRLSFDHYHRCVSLEDTTVGFLSRAIASYAFDVTTCERRDGIFTEGWKKKQEREIHWRYGLVTARVERTTWQKKRERERNEWEREGGKKSDFFSVLFCTLFLRALESRSRKRLGLFAPSNLLLSKRSLSYLNF